ncbi:unnamed protein product [Spirodela intermedia]|uniref:F-box domain-containing protein n=1 Tax=Spirodela intermedia TaxID=51605 RepID=A0A7I8I854_SPIIN|nr:unnamed protein product [Spirodela intermedia]CAA6653583.1 unnamed protein product [Spirodela intermedia]
MNCRNLPDEICTEILSWLPAKQVARCRSLCKGFRAVTRASTSTSRRLAGEGQHEFRRLGEGVDVDVVCVTPTDYWSCFMECWLSSWERRWKLVSDKVFLAHRSIKIHHPVLAANGLIYLASTCGRHKRQIPPFLLAVDVRVGSSRILPLPEKAALASDDGDIEKAGSGSGSLLSLVLCNRASEFTIWDVKDPDRWVWRSGASM